MERKKILIIGAAGRDFHNFNTYFKDKKEFEVVAFTAAQIPNIAGRNYPPELAGSLYPKGIPIYDELKLEQLIHSLKVDSCIFSYSDVSYQKVMQTGALVNSAGANFVMLGHNETMLKPTKPVIAIGAVRTGCGKSQTSARVIEIVMQKGLKVVAVRHPMPYGNLVSQAVQRFANISDFKKHECTIEEIEEYEPHVSRGNVIYSGVDYKAILEAAENDINGCDVIVWDGGNNDFPFFKPNLMITVTDPHRPGHELNFYPGEICLRLANVAIINKIDTANGKDIDEVRHNINTINPSAVIIECASPVKADTPNLIKGKKVLVVEDGPTLTHGEMKLGAGIISAQKYGASAIIDPRPYIVGSIADTFAKYPHIGSLLPAMGYSAQQLKDLETSINQTPCDTVIIATPIDLGRLIKINKPTVRVHYRLQEIGEPNLENIINEFVRKYVK